MRISIGLSSMPHGYTTLRVLFAVLFGDCSSWKGDVSLQY